jgi:hypothetical protein
MRRNFAGLLLLFHSFYLYLLTLLLPATPRRPRQFSEGLLR